MRLSLLAAALAATALTLSAPPEPGREAEATEAGAVEAGPLPASRLARDMTQPQPGEHRYLLLATGNVQGWHEPCGCAERPAGGISRRVALDRLLAESTGKPRLWVDAGNFAGEGPGEIEWARTLALLETMARLDVAAVNVGRRELDAGLERIVETGRELGIPLTSASLVDAATGRPLLPEFIVVQRGGLSIGLIGLAEEGAAHDAADAGRGSPDADDHAAPSDRTDAEAGGALEAGGAGDAGPAATDGGPDPASDVAFRPAQEALVSALAALDERDVDHVVLLAALPHERVAELLVAHGERVDAVVQALGAARPHGRLEGVPVLSLGSRGQVVAELATGRHGAEDPSTIARYHLLEERYPSEPETLELERRTTRRVTQLRRRAAQRLAARRRPAPPTHAGASACRACHVAEYLAWERSPHSSAMESLVEAGSEWEPSCVSCHATSVGRPGGFRSLVETPELANVQCESCHGPMADHAATGRSQRGPEEASRLTAATCTGCHDEANSPGFEAESAWERIRHGGPLAASR